MAAVSEQNKGHLTTRPGLIVQLRKPLVSQTSCQEYSRLSDLSYAIAATGNRYSNPVKA